MNNKLKPKDDSVWLSSQDIKNHNDRPVFGVGRSRIAGAIFTKEPLEPDWVEERVRINSDCVKVVRTNLNAEIFIDPKGDGETIERMLFFTRGQKAYGEWLKHLTKNEKAPRGKCANFFVKNIHLKINY